MRSVCFIAANQGVPWGASELLWAGSAEVLARHYDVLVTISVKGWSADLIPVRRLQSLGCRLVTRSSPDDEEAFWKGQAPSGPANEILGFRPDLVVVSHGDNSEGLPWMEFCSAQGLPFVSLAHRASEWDWPESTTASRLRGAYLSARATHFVSLHNLRLTERMIGSRLERAAVVRNPFQVDYEEAAPWPGQDGPARMACVARLDLTAKAQDVLFQVLAAPKWRDRDLIVDIVGREGPHAEVLRDLAFQLSLERVTFRDAVDDIRSVWAQCHALLLPSRKEGLPIAIVEAMMSGRPCLVTDAGGSAEVIEPGRTGWVAESATVSALDRALEEAWCAREEWREMGERAAREIRKQVPADPSSTYADVLRQLLDV